MGVQLSALLGLLLPLLLVERGAAVLRGCECNDHTKMLTNTIVCPGPRHLRQASYSLNDAVGMDSYNGARPISPPTVTMRARGVGKLPPNNK